MQGDPFEKYKPSKKNPVFWAGGSVRKNIPTGEKSMLKLEDSGSDAQKHQEMGRFSPIL